MAKLHLELMDKVALLVAEELRFPSEPDGVHLSSLCTFLEPEDPGDHWLIIMRPQSAQALEQLAWT